MVAVPNLTFTVTPPGGSTTDYTSHLSWSGAGQSMTINQNFGRQGDTAVFALVDSWAGQAHPNFWIPTMSQVSLRDNTLGKVLFAGIANDPVQQVTGAKRNEWVLNCTDFTFLADNKLVHGTYYGWTVDAIIIDLVKQANCGITAAKVSAGGFVAPGPLLPSFVLNYTTLSAAWRKLAQLAGQTTPYGWYVDENRRLHFYDATTALSSGVTFTTSPTTSGSTTEGHIVLDSQNGYEWDGTSIRNRILVQGATQTVTHGTPLKTTATASWVGNGHQQSWSIAYTVTGSPSLYVGGSPVAVTVVGAGETSNATWQIVQNSIGAWSLTNTVSAPADGVVIRLWYSYQVPIVMAATDTPSQSQYRLTLEEFISDSSLTTAPMALARAMRERTEYAFAPERASFTTSEDWIGWVRAGQTFTLNNALVRDVQSNSWGVNDTFICIGNTVNFVAQGGYRRMQITAVRL